MNGWVKSTMVTAILIQVLNKVIYYFIRWSAGFGYFSKTGDKDYNIIWKSILAYFLNTTLAAYLLKMLSFGNGEYSAIWGKKGLTDFVWNLSLSYLISYMAGRIMSIPFVMGWLKRKWYTK